MASTVRHRGVASPSVAFPIIERRSIAVNTANLQLAVGDERGAPNTGNPLSLIAIRYFATTAQYSAGDMVVQGGQIWKAKVSVSPGAFDPSQWLGMTDGGQFVLLDGTREMTGNLEIDKPGASLVLNAIGASQADIWFRRDSLTRWLFRSDETSLVDFHIYRFNDAGFVIDAPLSIDRATGHVTVLFDPVGPRGVVSKAYADSLHDSLLGIANDRVLRTGDTMSGGLTVPVLTIRNAGYSDLYFAEGDGAARWLIRGNDPTTANLEIHRYNSVGGYLGYAMILDNVTGDATFAGVIKASPGLQFGGSASSGFYGDGGNVAIRTYGNNNIYLQNGGGTTNYGVFHPGGLDVYGVITSTTQDGLRNTVPAGYFARSVYTVSGARTWSAGTAANGMFLIQDENAPWPAITLDPFTHMITLNGDVWMPGTFTSMGPVNAPTGNFTTGNFGTVNTGTLNVSGNGDIAGNLVVHGTLTATGGTGGGGGGTGAIGDGNTYVTAKGYRTKNGVDGPFVGWGGSATPAYFNVGLQPPAGSLWGMYIDNTFLGTIPTTMASVRVNGAAPWETVKALEPTEDIPADDNEHPPLLSDKVITALTKALQQAMARIEALELKVQELTNAGAR